MEKHYLDELVHRVQERSRDLSSFQYFLEVCELLRARLWIQ